MYFGSSYLIYVLPAVLLAMWASYSVKATYTKYSKFDNRKGYTAAEVAGMILRRNGINHVRIEQVAGNLTDHYDSKNNVLRLSQSVYNSRSLAAIGIAAHECGHAIQDEEAYFFLRLRHAIVPGVNIASKAAMPLAFIGLLMGAASNIGGIGYLLLQAGIIMFGAVLAFHVITLPVELDASRRAINILEGEGILNSEEIVPAKRVLRAAAMTYIAAAAVALGNFLRFLMLSRGRRR